jgi:phosphatidylglycerophosphate synthase
MTGTLIVQQTLVGLALNQRAAEKPGGLSLVDFMTLSRGGGAAILVGLLASGVRDRRGRAGWIGWSALIYGAILCDWLDGPIARRMGTSEAGAVFDFEADSWLTLCSAAAAVAWGQLPMYVAVAPLLRYPLLFLALRRMPYPQIISGDPLWVRHIGMAQMMLFMGALAPYGGRITALTVRLAAPVIAPVALGSLLWVYKRKLYG